MSLEELKNFSADTLSPSHGSLLADLRSQAVANIVRMLQGAGSGHLGGALSSLDMLLMLYLCANVAPGRELDARRDRIVVSHGHVSSALYTVLGLLGYVDLRQVNEGYRRGGSLFEGHPNKEIPGVEWASGSLGQGLSVGCGFALAARLQKRTNHVFVLMGDGEQQKGQIHEAVSFAAKYRLAGLTAIVDFNGLQSSGPIDEIMPQDIAAMYRQGGFAVTEIDGHDFSAIYGALRSCRAEKERPTLILAHTVMGKGFPMIENDYHFHGKQLSQEEAARFLRHREDSAGSWEPSVDAQPPLASRCVEQPVSAESCVDPGVPRQYALGASVDPRDAFGKALGDLFRQNRDGGDKAPLVALDCDLAESTRLFAIRDEYPDSFVECGIAEHNAATIAAALSRDGCVSFFADFAVFGLDETYGQHRMTDFNKCALKLIITHTGLEVGQDGKTHQCIDYLSLAGNLYGYRLIVPADANQIDRVIRYVATHPGSFIVALGRSPKPILWDAGRKSPCYAASNDFVYGNADWLRNGADGCIMTYGSTVCRALEIADTLAARGLRIGVLNVSCPKEISLDDLRAAAATGHIVTWEDHNVLTGMGSIVGALLAENGISCRFRRFGIRQYGLSADPEYQYAAQHMAESDVMEELEAPAVAHSVKGEV